MVSCQSTSSARVVLLALVSAFGVACTTPIGDPGVPSQQAEYLIAPPDQLMITVRPEPEIVRTVVVRPDGRISFDLIGDVEVRDRTVDQVRDAIATRLREFIVQPDVTVVLAKSESRTFYVFGEVIRPGAYPLIGEVTALHALGAAGGPTRFAAQDDARLVRPRPEGKLVYGVRFEGITQYGTGVTNYVLQPGDVIYVPPNGFAKVGYALGIVLFPIQQIIGLGNSAYNASTPY